MKKILMLAVLAVMLFSVVGVANADQQAQQDQQNQQNSQPPRYEYGINFGPKVVPLPTTLNCSDVIEMMGYEFACHTHPQCCNYYE